MIQHSSGIDSATTTVAAEPVVAAARNVVSALIAAGVDKAFTVPGESFLPVLDALFDETAIQTISVRHEGGAAFMADAYAKLSGKLTLCMATRAVGAANLAIGLHTAHQDSSPVIAVLGQVSGSAKHREAFQETSLETFLGAITKWSIEPATSNELGNLTYRAARLATEGRPGPVALALREDLLSEPVSQQSFPRLVPSRLYPGEEETRVALELLRRAERPVMLLGADTVTSRAMDLFVRIAQQEHLPVVAGWRRPDSFPNASELYLGHSGLSSPPCVRATLAEADVLLVVGSRIDENTSFGYTIPSAGCDVIHVDTDAGRLEPQGEGVGIVSNADTFAAKLLEVAARATASDASGKRKHWIASRRAKWIEQSRPRARPVAAGYADQFGVAAVMRELMPKNAVLVTDAGNFSGYSSRYLTWQQNGTFLGPGSGAMGYAVPGAIGAQLAAPDRPVIGVVGDGCFLMTGSELQTAAREALPITIVVFHNGQYGTIRMYQQNTYPDRPIATDLGSSVDFVMYAQSLGAEAFEVTATEQFGQAFTAALASPRPAVVVVHTDPAQIAVGMYDSEFASPSTSAP